MSGASRVGARGSGAALETRPLPGREAGRALEAAERLRALPRHFLLVASHDFAIAEVDSAGRVLGARSLIGKHPQAEGIALAPRGELVISDEGTTGPGRITVYACR